MRISDWSSDVCSSDLHQLITANAMAQTGFTDQRRCMGRGLTVMNLPANDQPAKDIHHKVQTTELTTHCSGQECDIPRPNLARCGGGPGARPFGHMGRSSAAPMIQSGRANV